MFCWAGFVGVATGDSGKWLVLYPLVVALLSDELHHIKSLSGMSVLMDGETLLGGVSSVSMVSELGGWESSESVLYCPLGECTISSSKKVVLSGMGTALLA